MSNNDAARRAHELLDRLGSLTALSKEQEKLLRSFLPERPKPVTLEELRDRVHDAWVDAGASTWTRDGIDLDDFLLDLRDDLTRLLHEPAPTAPVLPAGMRLAEHEEYGRVVVSPKPNDIGQYKIFHLDDSYVSGGCASYVEADTLTSIDAEPDKPTHPEFLQTVDDYENAPEGTVVEAATHGWARTKYGSWRSPDGKAFGNIGMSGAPRRVLRWGWGE